MEIELYKGLYQSLNSLASVVGLDEEALQKYFVPEGNTGLDSVLFRLCSSLQNSGMMHNSIKFNDKNLTNRNIIKKVLFDFDAVKSFDTYKSWESIYNEMLKNGITDNGIKMKKESNWQKYCRGIYDGLKFLTADKGGDLIKELASISALTDKELKTISNISKQIHGLGFALTCDWLKECGCTWLAKPDVHINGVVQYMKGAEKLSDLDVLNYMFSWADSVKKYDSSVTAYKIDKIIWLLCTGEFYLDNKKIGREAIYNKIDLLRV